MTKDQAIHTFWSSFEIPAYDENSVPDGAEMPYITYSVYTGSLDSVLPLTASIWDRSTSWTWISNKKEEIAQKLESYFKLKVDHGYVWFVQGQPFAQRMSDPDDSIKRIYLNVQAEFLTAY